MQIIQQISVVPTHPRGFFKLGWEVLGLWGEGTASPSGLFVLLSFSFIPSLSLYSWCVMCFLAHNAPAILLTLHRS